MINDEWDIWKFITNINNKWDIWKENKREKL